MRSLLSYFLLICLLSPTITEAFHAFYDTHTHISEQKVNVHELNHNCQISYFLSLIDDNGNLPLHSIVSYLNYSQINHFNLEIDFIDDNLFDSISKRGPPVLA
tara:strand:+ start:247 stop:555 length:309 start_codon:yes stop_codon:yes gene_type:complete